MSDLMHVSVNVRDVSLWDTGDGWFWCVSGTYRGIYSESDDAGPYPTAADALDDGALYAMRYPNLNEDGLAVYDVYARVFTPKQIALSARLALDNWEWDAATRRGE